jgi:hypothetical protein
MSGNDVFINAFSTMGNNMIALFLGLIRALLPFAGVCLAAYVGFGLLSDIISNALGITTPGLTHNEYQTDESSWLMTNSHEDEEDGDD